MHKRDSPGCRARLLAPQLIFLILKLRLCRLKQWLPRTAEVRARLASLRDPLQSALIWVAIDALCNADDWPPNQLRPLPEAAFGRGPHASSQPWMELARSGWWLLSPTTFHPLHLASRRVGGRCGQRDEGKQAAFSPARRRLGFSRSTRSPSSERWVTPIVRTGPDRRRQPGNDRREPPGQVRRE
jgi:hypothetical protein